MKLLRSQSVVPRPAAPGSAATPQPVARRVSRRAILAAAAILVGIACLAGRHWVVTTPGFAVRRVVIEGAVHSDVASLAAAAGARGVNMFQVDLDAVRDRVASDPWIQDARVRRLLPHELRVSVVERVPVGIQELGATRTLVDGTGRLLATLEDGHDFRLPAIVGVDRLPEPARAERTTRAAASLEAVRAASPGLFDRVESIDVSDAGRFVLLTDSLPPIWISGPESADEVAGYASRIATFRRTFGDIDYVDARWRDRLFVLPRG